MNAGSLFYVVHERTSLKNETLFTGKNAARVRNYHRSFPEYTVTPLTRLRNLADRLGVADIYVKDESRRFGLNAFKVLGGSYSIGRWIADNLGLKMEETDFSILTSPEVSEKIKDFKFVTATDGNHGRGVAWTANRLGCQSVVYMPQGSAEERLQNIRAAGADAMITEWNYDDTVRYAASQAERNGWILVQDTSWEGYRDIPLWIMEGYTTMADEIAEQLNGEIPTHVFLQAGVGSMAGAMAGCLADIFGNAAPKVIVVEPHQANCVYLTAKANDGTLHKVTGKMDSMMAGLCCGEPCELAWEELSAHADIFASISDEISALGMRILGNPLTGDERIISGESGAAGLGLAAAACLYPEYQAFKEAAGICESSRILCISTEGDTDRTNYRRVVWGL